MALQLFDLNRSNDTPIATLRLGEIEPEDWRRFPPAIDDSDRVHVPVIDYFGGAPLDVQETAQYETGTANATNEFAPRTQQDKATAMGVTLAPDIGRRRGPIAPGQPYPDATTPAPAVTLVSLEPNTAVVGSPPLIVRLTGSGFTEWSRVTTGGYSTTYFRFISPTRIDVMMDPTRAAAGETEVVVVDGGVESAPLPFTFTAAP